MGVPSTKEWRDVENFKLLKNRKEEKPKKSLEERFSRISTEGIKFLKKLLVFNPENRMTANEALEEVF